MFSQKTVMEVRCPNCGHPAERHYAESDQVRTQCPACDYLMVTHAITGSVIESYAPGIYSRV
ncbi:MAG TPA: hypothetical protein V6D18_18590 [Thermosynechococcaceae cyanobacterium]